MAARNYPTIDPRSGAYSRTHINNPLSNSGGYNGMPGTPAQPTLQSMALQQGELNRQAAYDQGRLANPNQVGPFGSTTWTENPGGRPTVTTSLSPEQQRIYDQTSGLMSQGLMGLGAQFGKPLDMSGVPNAPDLSNTLTRDKLAQSLIDRDQPFMDRHRSRSETQLANQGIMQGSNAYQSVQDDLSRAENDFRLGAFARAGDEQAREYGLQQDARQNAINEQLTQRQLPLNELNALRTGSQVNVPQAQSFGGYNYQAPDLYGAYSDQLALDQSRRNANQASRDNLTSGLFGLGGSLGLGYLFAASDRRLKENIKKVGVTDNGLNVYTYNYIGNPITQMGVMADEVEKIIPQAVMTGNDGFKRVNYSYV